MIKKIEFDECLLVLIDNQSNQREDKLNKVDLYTKQGVHIWNISELLSELANRDNHQYVEDYYFDMKIIDDDFIRVYGFYNACDISMKSKKIIRLINNR